MEPQGINIFIRTRSNHSLRISVTNLVLNLQNKQNMQNMQEMQNFKIMENLEIMQNMQSMQDIQYAYWLKQSTPGSVVPLPMFSQILHFLLTRLAG